eukprot:277826_1
MTHELTALKYHECKWSIDDCISCQKVFNTLKIYDKWLYSEENKTVNCINNLLNEYSTKNTTNDYHHIKKHHKPQIETLDLLCQHGTDCIPLNRHKRDNDSLHKHNYYTTNIKEVITQKMFDQIHINLYHPILFNQKTENHSSIYQRFGSKILVQSQENNIIDSNEEKLQLQIEPEQKHEKDLELKQSTQIDFEKDAYNFGQQFFYWNYYQNNYWFITSKYDNLKDELYNNLICKIDPYLWNLENENADDKINDDEKVKELLSNAEFTDTYGIPENIIITKKHLLSILFYCNTDELQSNFSATYRRQINESDDELKQRHSNYYWFGKLLREAVEVFGNVLVDDGLALYHGIDHPLYFTKMIAKFYAPTSTSKNRDIAARFAGDGGMILEFGIYERNSFYFDCFISAYDREEEYLFIGGFVALKIKNILHFDAQSGDIHNYHQHLVCIQCFFAALSSINIDQQLLSSLPDINDEFCSLIKNRISVNNVDFDHELPTYIINLFDFRC